MADKRGKHKTDEAAKRTKCKEGHEYTRGNTYIKGNGARVCRKCKNLWQRRARFKKDRENFLKYTEMLKE